MFLQAVCLFSPDALTLKSGVKFVQVAHVSLFSSPEKEKGAATGEKMEHDTKQGHRWRMQSTWIDHISWVSLSHPSPV